MYHYYNKPPHFNIDFAGRYACSIEQTRQSGTNEQQPTYQGMSVQAYGTPLPVYHDQPDTHRNSTGPCNFLNEYNIAPLTLADTAGFFGTDISEELQSVLDAYLPWDPGDGLANDPLSPIPDIHFLEQLCLSGSETEIMEQTPATYSNPDYQLNNPPVVHSNQQNLPQVAVVNPLNGNQTSIDNHTPPAEAIVDTNASRVKRRRKHYQDDPDYAERQRELQRKLQRKRYQNNPDYAERKRVRQRERYHNDPDYAERQRERQRERCKDPAYAERLRERSRVFQRERSKDPAYAERLRESKRKNARERFQNDPIYAQRLREYKRKNARERYQNDPIYAQRLREQKRVRQRELYKKIKNKAQNEAAQKNHVYNGPRSCMNTDNSTKRQTSDKGEA
ncbi:hypothetical protein [Endozoicomonas sp. YOMI1]|uniref:hypothetical protein n=1 Tax=Endozoicomonas sp. YOMI1 TaxID=2828739 RepID=UPI00214983A9|nr:hypothetical protein [Endozoicomonas sp. YOMI1]